MKLKESIIEAPILHYPDPNKRYIVYTYASDDACGAQLSQEHDGIDSLLPFFCIPFQKHKENGAPLNRKLKGIHYAITKWNYYLQKADIIVQNDHKPLNKFLNGKKHE